MTDTTICPVVMPKWGLSMSEGRVGEWIAKEGETIRPGQELLDVETDKIAGTVEATDAGILRRRVAEPDQVLPVGALLGVLAEADTPDADIDAFIAQFNADFVPPEADEDSAESAYQWLELNGQKLRYTRQGNGDQTVLLIHGFGGDLDNWLFNLGDLAAKHTVYALDLPGHGQSSKTLSDNTLDSLARTVLDVMNALDIEQAHLVGHSLGGAISLKTALTAPAKVASLNLIGSAALGPDINKGYIEGFIKGQSRRDMKPVLQQLFADPALVTRQLIEDILKYKRLDGVSQTLQQLADGVFANGQQSEVLRDQLASLKMPVQAIWGAQDQIVPARHAEDLPATVTVTVLDGYGHMVQMEAASEVNRLLLAQIEKAAA
ncbi:MAG: acetoin dehydrogenase dihydrolipoyllysine-residue acetyltransferase subunit [Gammaproteobacteria bacterium]